MDTVVFDGVEFVKASVLAKQFRYTSDYIGQLCRAKKIDARLVGRTWFVNPESVVEHKKRKKLKKVPAPSAEESSITKETKTSRKIVLPVMQNKTVKVTNDLALKIRGVETRSLKVAYEPDDETLFPKLIRKKVRPPKTIRIEQANAKKIKVTGKKSETSFTAGDLPEVSLSGKLKITSYSEPEPQVDNDPAHKTNTELKQPSVSKAKPSDHKNSLKNKVISDKQETPIKETLIKVDNDKKEVLPVKVVIVKPKLLKVVESPDEPKRKAPIKEVKAKKVTTSPVATVEKVTASPFVPEEESAKDDLVLSPIQPKHRIPVVMLVSPLIATIAALLCVLFIFSASTTVVAVDSSYDSQVMLQVANLLELLSQ